jgi:hypothetical protein
MHGREPLHAGRALHNIYTVYQVTVYAVLCVTVNSSRGTLSTWEAAACDRQRTLV